MPATASKRVLVAGGGPAGMQAAITAAERGHRVSLFERLEHCGGQLIAAAAAPFRPGWGELQRHLEAELTRLQIDVRLSTALTPDLARAEAADTAIVACGATPIRLTVPGAERANVLFARDLLEGAATAHGRVVVIGGGCAGTQTAEFLATRGLPVRIIELLSTIAIDAPRAERELLLERLNTLGVTIHLETKLMRVDNDRVIVESLGREAAIPADTVVLCLGSTPTDALVPALHGVVPQVLVVGDAVKARKVTDAIVEGALAAITCG
jgi:NADPH-dependent 2,4-dienoyl-CoA reductase/sulfur reductase-like enzyme